MGALITSGAADIQTAWWYALMPGTMLFLTVLGCNLLGDGRTNGSIRVASSAPPDACAARHCCGAAPPTLSSRLPRLPEPVPIPDSDPLVSVGT